MNIPKLLPWLVGGVAVLASAAAFAPPAKVRGFDLDAFGQLPVLEGGRVKPIDSIARNSLLMIRGHQTYQDSGRTAGADEWLLDLMFRPEVADNQKVFVITDPEVLGLIGLRLERASDKYFSFNTIGPHLDEIQRQYSAAQGIDPKQRSRFQNSIVNLFERIYTYYRLKNTVQAGRALQEELKAPGAAGAAERARTLAQLAYFRPLPPLPGEKSDHWRTTGEALGAGLDDPGMAPLARLGAAWAAGDTAAFNAAVADLKAVSAAVVNDANQQARHEVLFNRAQPFYAGMVLYVLALLALFVSWIWKPAILQPTSYALLTAGAVVHTAGLVSRVILQGRPPVTNLYSSAVFVGWGAVILGLIAERMYRKGFGTAVAAACGFVSLFVAHHLTGDGDTMEMMRAVLDSNFWLATHVITITIGYSATYLAGAIAIGYTLREHLVRRVDPATTQALASMTYGVLCFALLFSFVGTVLGGIWADQSWGRFWGWDPKENGALLIVLWIAIILHARWGGYIRERGIMAMSIGGNIITSFSWFGVNMLGVGLHSYGFMGNAFWALAGFTLSQLFFLGLCLMPRRLLRGAEGAAARRAAPTPSRTAS